MRITSELIRRCSSKHLLPGQQEDPLERITHLYLQEQHIKIIENLHPCRNLIALYLYDNKIEKIENLDHLVCLSCLYLHKNCISRIENLDMLNQLTVLNLSHNCISKVEGLEALCELRELYIQYQKLPEDQSLKFDPATITWLSDTLRVLNVSGNRLKSLSPLRELQHMETFTGEENELQDLPSLLEVLAHWKYVQVVKLTANPVCDARKYRDNIVVTCLELEELDGKVIPQSYRNFLLNWKQCQSLQARKKESYAVLKPFLETRRFVEEQVANIPNTAATFHSWIASQLSSTWESIQTTYQSAIDNATRAVESIPKSLNGTETRFFAQCTSCKSKYFIYPPSTENGQPDLGYWLYVQPPAATFERPFTNDRYQISCQESNQFEQGDYLLAEDQTDFLTKINVKTEPNTNSDKMRWHPYLKP